MSIAFVGASGVQGEKRYACGTVTLTDQASGAVEIPGISYIEGGTVGIGGAWGGATFAVGFNEGSGATAINGMLHIKSAASGDVFGVHIVGR